jgi:hypothetical protein
VPVPVEITNSKAYLILITISIKSLVTSKAIDYLAALGHHQIAFVATTPPSANRVVTLDDSDLVLGCINN